MTGIADYNYPAFHAAAHALREAGHEVVNPAELNAGRTEWLLCMRRSVAALTECQTLALLPGWEGSPGSHLELYLAHRLSMRITKLDSAHRLDDAAQSLQPSGHFRAALECWQAEGTLIDRAYQVLVGQAIEIKALKDRMAKLPGKQADQIPPVHEPPQSLVDELARLAYDYAVTLDKAVRHADADDREQVARVIHGQLKAAMAKALSEWRLTFLVPGE